MPLRKLVDRVTKSVEDRDREQLAAFCDDLDEITPLDQLPLRIPVRVAGEISSVRIVPRAGAPALEVTISDGRGSVVAVFLGRRRIAAMSPGPAHDRRRRRGRPRARSASSTTPGTASCSLARR